VSLRYPELNTASRRQIWAQFLGDSYIGGFSTQELDRIAEEPLNGRQIKNVLRIARFLAREQGTQLHFEQVLSAAHLHKLS
jgi:hypothetical protein